MSELAQLQTACKEAHEAYRASRAALAATINKSPDSEAIAELVASTQELGLHATLHRLKSNDPKVADAITTLVEASDSLSLAVGERERFLTQQNPAHQRAYVDDGREFTLDIEKGIWTYLDDPGNPIKVTLSKESKLPYDLSGFEPELDDDEPDRKRRRSQKR